jgi:hypothetical protein
MISEVMQVTHGDTSSAFPYFGLHDLVILLFAPSSCFSSAMGYLIAILHGTSELIISLGFWENPARKWVENVF